MTKKNASDTPAIDVDATVARLRTFIETFEAMDSENERMGTLYYLIARFYGNEIGDQVLRVLR